MVVEWEIQLICRVENRSLWINVSLHANWHPSTPTKLSIWRLLWLTRRSDSRAASISPKHLRPHYTQFPSRIKFSLRTTQHSSLLCGAHSSWKTKSCITWLTQWVACKLCYYGCRGKWLVNQNQIEFSLSLYYGAKSLRAIKMSLIHDNNHVHDLLYDDEHCYEKS